MIKVLILADDFTGALDTGVQFSNQSANVLVTTNQTVEFDKVDSDVEVLVIDTESRYLNHEEAYRIIHAIISRAIQRDIPYIYKKVDSALRGNISFELKAIMDLYKECIIPFLPAYPEMNRTVVEGKLYVNQLPVTESVFGKDPYEPVTESNILKRLEQEAGIDAELVRINEVPSQKKQIIIFDAQTTEDLQHQLLTLSKMNALSISTGCAGFASVLARHLFPGDKREVPLLKQHLVVICGSINLITKKQIEYAEARGYTRISLTADQLLNSSYWDSYYGQKAIQRYLKLMMEHELIMFETLSESTIQDISSYKKKAKMSLTDIRFRIGESLGELTKYLWQNYSLSTFLFTGGDTLFQSMKVVGVDEIRPIVELSEGVVLSKVKWQQMQIEVITKSGGFGEETLFVDLIEEREGENVSQL